MKNELTQKIKIKIANFATTHSISDTVAKFSKYKISAQQVSRFKFRYGKDSKRNKGKILKSVVQHPIQRKRFSQEHKDVSAKIYLGGNISIKEASEIAGCAPISLRKWIKAHKEKSEIPKNKKVNSKLGCASGIRSILKKASLDLRLEYAKAAGRHNVAEMRLVLEHMEALEELSQATIV